jgi:hypothetical protein
VIVAPAEGRFAATAIMVPTTAQTTQVNTIEHSDFTPTSEQAL